MDSHLTSQSSTIFRSVHSLIYIFDAESGDLTSSDTHYFLKCLNALRDQNPIAPASSDEGIVATPNEEGNEGGPTVFVLLHKMDLVPEGQQASKLAEFEADVTKRAVESGWKGGLKFYGTSIWDETLYKVRRVVLLFSAATMLTFPSLTRPGQSSLRTSCPPSPPSAPTSRNSSNSPPPPKWSSLNVPPSSSSPPSPHRMKGTTPETGTSGVSSESAPWSRRSSWGAREWTPIARSRQGGRES